VGLPGAGKSAVAAALPPHLGPHDLRAVGIDRATHGGRARLARYAAFLAFLARRWRFAVAVAEYAAGIHPRSLERLRFSGSILTHAFLLAERATWREDVVILHQATLQTVWSVAVRGTPPRPESVRRLVAELLRDVGGRYAVVHLDVQPETALRRVHQRPTNGSRFDRMTAAEATALLPELRRHLDVMMDAVATARVPYVRLDAELPLPDSCAAVAAFVRELAHAVPGARGRSHVAPEAAESTRHA
jgi:hypothetical protein